MTNIQGVPENFIHFEKFMSNLICKGLNLVLLDLVVSLEAYRTEIMDKTVLNLLKNTYNILSFVISLEIFDTDDIKEVCLFQNWFGSIKEIMNTHF